MSKILINERQLSETIMNVLNELYGREITLSNGESDGYEYSKYGTGTITVETDIDNYADDMFMGNEDEEEAFIEEVSSYDMWPPEVEIVYTCTAGMKGDGYLTPDDPDEFDMIDWKIVGIDNIQNENTRNRLIKLVEKYMNNFDLEDYLYSNNLV